MLHGILWLKEGNRTKMDNYDSRVDVTKHTLSGAEQEIANVDDSHSYGYFTTNSLLC